jgi:hypothetical protein
MVPTAMLGVRVLDDIDDRAGELAADGQTLQEPQQDKRRPGQGADLRVRRQQADQHRRHGHQRH